MDRWTDGQMDRWTDSQMDRWTDGQMDRRKTDGPVDLLTYECRDEQLNGQVDRWIEELTDRHSVCRSLVTELFAISATNCGSYQVSDDRISIQFFEIKESSCHLRPTL
jgi:hypothetical protein